MDFLFNILKALAIFIGLIFLIGGGFCAIADVYGLIWSGFKFGFSFEEFKSFLLVFVISLFWFAIGWKIVVPILWSSNKENDTQ